MRRLLAISALIGACGPAYVPDADDATTIAVIVGTAPRTVVIAPFDPSTPATPLTDAADGDELTALYFSADRVLPLGTFVEDDRGPWARPLPAPLQARSRRWGEDAWQTVDPAALVPLSIPVEPPRACAERGGCYVDAEALVCTVPCPAAPEPAPPDAPLPPAYLPCPSGWTDDPAAFVCRAPVAACARGERRPVGEASCRAPGPACVDEWPAVLDPTTTQFVRAGEVGGTGTRDRPWGTIATALEAASAGDTVALARGTHAAPPRIEGAWILRGACAAQTRVVATSTLALASGPTVSDVSIEAPVLRAQGGAQLTGVGVVAELIVDSGTLTLSDAVVEGPLRLRAGAAVDAHDLALRGAPAISVTSGARATVSDADLSGTAATREGTLIMTRARIETHGLPALVAERGTFTLERVELSTDDGPVVVDLGEGSRLTAQHLHVARGRRALDVAPDTTLSLTDSVIAGADSVDDITVRAYASDVFMERVRMTSTDPLALYVDGKRSRIGLHSFAVTSTTGPRVDLLAGQSIVIQRATLRGITLIKLLDHRGVASAYDAELEDVLIHGGVLRLRGEGRIRVSRLEIDDPIGAGLSTEPSPRTPDVDVRDLRLVGTHPDAACGNPVLCSGAAVVSAGALAIERFFIAESTGPALMIAGTTERSTLRRGTIARQRLGIVLETAPADLWPLLEGVTLRDVDVTCEPCGR